MGTRTVVYPLRDEYELSKCADLGGSWQFNRQLMKGDHGTSLVAFFSTEFRKKNLIGLIVHYRSLAAKDHLKDQSLSKRGLKPVWYFYVARASEPDVGIAGLAGPKGRPICGSLNEVIRRANSYLRAIAQKKDDSSKKYQKKRKEAQGQLPLPGIPDRKKK